jgi:hypothetical protein
MAKINVYLAFPFDQAFENECRSLDPKILQLFTTGQDYLQWIELNQNKYLGRTCPHPLTFEELQNVVANLKSLVKKIAPHFTLPSTSLRLLALQEKVH